MNSQRRILLTVLPAAAGGAVLASGAALAQPARVAETDANAMALGYKHEASAVDTKKYPQYVKGTMCSNCMLYAGKPADAWAPCGALGNKQVKGSGWCAAYAKKPA